MVNKEECPVEYCTITTPGHKIHVSEEGTVIRADAIWGRPQRKFAPDWLPSSDLPQGAIPTAALVIVNYIDVDGNNKRYVSAKGDSPATTYLGMTVYAQADILDWDR